MYKEVRACNRISAVRLNLDWFPFWQLSLMAVLTKEPEMLQDAFCKHTVQQNSTAAGAPTLKRSPKPLVRL